MTSLILLAAGDNTRMISNKPKVLQKLSGKTLIQHIVDTVSSLSQITKVFIVYKNEILKSIFSKKKTDGSAWPRFIFNDAVSTSNSYVSSVVFVLVSIFSSGV